MCTKNYQNRDRLDEATAQIKRCRFFLPHMTETLHYCML